MNRHFWLSAVAAGAWLAAPGTVRASTFSLSPVRLEMNNSHPTGVLTLHNDGDAPVTVQVQPVAWRQEAGEDHYEQTAELLVTPPVFVLPAKADQIVRVARRGTPNATEELSYRLFFQEVPQAAANLRPSVQVALRIGVPVFIAPAGAKPNLEFRAHWQADGSLDLAVSNHGNAHVQITDFELLATKASVIARTANPRYVLVGSEVHFTLAPVPGTDKPTLGRLNGNGDLGVIAADLSIGAL